MSTWKILCDRVQRVGTVSLCEQLQLYAGQNLPGYEIPYKLENKGNLLVLQFTKEPGFHTDVNQKKAENFTECSSTIPEIQCMMEIIML